MFAFEFQKLAFIQSAQVAKQSGPPTLLRLEFIVTECRGEQTTKGTPSGSSKAEWAASSLMGTLESLLTIPVKLHV